MRRGWLAPRQTKARLRLKILPKRLLSTGRRRKAKKVQGLSNSMYSGFAKAGHQSGGAVATHLLRGLRRRFALVSIAWSSARQSFSDASIGRSNTLGTTGQDSTATARIGGTLQECHSVLCRHIFLRKYMPRDVYFLLRAS